MSSPLLSPLAAAAQPGTRRVDYFALAPDGSGNVHVPHWLGVIPGQITGWVSLGGDGSAIDAFWLGDGSELIAVLVGDDQRIWTNSLDPATNTWSGWQSNPDGTLHQLLVATS